jgi:hypothetical protein
MKIRLYARTKFLLSGKPEEKSQVTGFTFTSDASRQEISNWFSCYRKGFDSSTENAYFRTDIDYEFIRFSGSGCWQVAISL